MPINLGPQDVQLSVSLALPAAGANNTTGILDLENIAPNSDAKHLGLIAIDVPALVNHTDPTKTITFELQAAGPALANNNAAPLPPVPGAFANANPRQIAGVAGVANSGSPATRLYFFVPLDANGSSMEFLQVVQTVPAGDGVNGEVITYTWVYA